MTTLKTTGLHQMAGGLRNNGTTGLGLFTLAALGLYLATLAVMLWQEDRPQLLTRLSVDKNNPILLIEEPVTANLPGPQRY